jgi:hypothetical protein
VKLHTKKMKIPTRRLKKELHRQLMRSGPGYQKEWNDYKRDEYPRRPPTFRNQRSFNQYEGNYKRVDHEPRWTTSQRRSLTPRYQNLFLGHCYTCKNFGHKAINCRINERNKYARNMNGVNRRYGNNHGFVNKIYNSFYPLMEKNIVCYKCNYLGHKA